MISNPPFVFAFVRSLGQTIGITILGSMFNASVARYAEKHNQSTVEVEALAHAIHQIFIVIFIVAIIALIAAIFLPSHEKILEQQKNVV